jgi:hypothetical protein
MISWGNNIEAQTQALVTKQSYIDLAIKRSPLIGLYLNIKTFLLTFDLSEFESIYAAHPEVLDKGKTEMLLQYFAFQTLMAQHPEDYEFLSKELKYNPLEQIELVMKENKITTEGPLADNAHKALPAYIEMITKHKPEPVVASTSAEFRPQPGR